MLAGRPIALPGLGPAQARLGADEQVALELGNGVDDAHRQLSTRAGKIDPAQREAVNPHAEIGEFRHGGADIHGVAAEAIELGHNEHVAGLEPIHETGKAGPL